MKISRPTYLHLAILMFAGWLLSSSVFAQEGYNIKGKLNALSAPTTVYLVDLTSGNRVFVDSTQTINGSFNFAGKVEQPALMRIGFKGFRKSIDFYVENTTVDLSIYPKWENPDTISGGRENLIRTKYDVETKVLLDSLRKLSNKYEAASKEEKVIIEPKTALIGQQLRQLGMSYLRQYPNSIAALDILNVQFTIMSYKELSEVKNIISPDLAYYKTYKAFLNTFQEKEKVDLVGAKAPAFTLKTLSKKSFSIESLKGKFVVIDFWASWCAPCRSGNQKLKPIYQKFKDKGFEVVSISMDDKENLWKQAVIKDKLPWIQVSDLRGLNNSEIAKRYHVKMLPKMFLLNASGKIIAQDVQPEALDNLLESNLTR